MVSTNVAAAIATSAVVSDSSPNTAIDSSLDDHDSVAFVKMIEESGSDHSFSLNSETLLPSALEYASMHLFIFPCNPQKEPITEHGFKDATDDEAVIREWWEKHPRALIGVDCGRSNLVVFDLDRKNGVDGVTNFSQLCDEMGISTAGANVTRTPSGGMHLIYSYDHSNIPIRNSASVIASGVDVRGAGGYVIFPPSRSCSGKYNIEGNWSNPPLQLPENLADLALNKSQTTALDKTHSPIRLDDPHTAQETLEREIYKVKSCQYGNRNDQLNKSTYLIGKLVGEKHLQRDDVENRFRAAATECGLENREIDRTISSGLDAGIRDSQSSTCVNAVSDITMAAMFALKNRCRIRFCPNQLGWFFFDGEKWLPNSETYVTACAKDFVKLVYLEVIKTGNKSIISQAKQYLNRAKIDAVISLARSEPGIIEAPDSFDQNPLLINCKNGVLDLESGKLIPHNSDELHTKIMNVYFDPEARCPLWHTFLSTIMDGNERMISFLQKALGYSLSGLTGEQCFFFLFGDGVNGKSTLIRVISGILGSYSAKTRAETFYERIGEHINNDIACLSGKRFVSSSEMHSRRLNETLLKDVTGEDEITARYLHKEYFSFHPSFKLWMYGNERPTIRGTDTGIWRRVKLIPFSVVIPEANRIQRMPQNLLEESSGILNWMLEGFRMWRAEGIGTPPEVAEATNAYKTEMDTVQQFIDERCEVMDSHTVESRILYCAYKMWCNREGSECFSNKRFASILDAKHFERKRNSKGNYIRCGIRLSTIILHGDFQLEQMGNSIVNSEVN